MMISNAAYYVLESTGPRWIRHVLGVHGPEFDANHLGEDGISASQESVPLFGPGGWPDIERFDVTLIIELLEEELEVAEGMPTELSPLTVEERKARAAAVRGLVNARDGRFDKARTLFAEALSFDPTLDLTQIPTFWKLPRGGQDAAVGAYQDSGMVKEAKILSSNLNYHFRPKLVRRRPKPFIVPST